MANTNNTNNNNNTGRKKKRINFRLLLIIAAAVSFIAAMVIYFTSSFKNTEREYAIYSSMEEPTLPVVYANIEGFYANLMHGYLQDMGNRAATDCVTPLSENRRLGLRIKIYDNSISELSYEIRSLDLEHYIEKTVVTDFTTGADGDIYTELPIQNMIEKDTPYLLRIRMGLGERVVNYYTKIIWTDNDNIFRMLETATDFTAKTFDYESARDLTMYLETDANADNSTLGTVTLHSTFSQITWADSGMQLSSELEVSVREYDGLMGAVEVRYETESPGEAGENPDRYKNVDEFTMRAGADRIYMMNYQRKTNQIFEGNKHLFAGNRIRLGITAKEMLQTKKSENGRFIVFKTNKELWSYDQTGKKAVNIFSFRSENDKLRADYHNFDIKILSADDNGDVDFVVYGYMNRGRHEGYNGIVYYRYNSANDSIGEILFIPVQDTFENIKLEIDQLCIKSNTGMVYIKQDDAVTAIDSTSQEMMSVVSNLSDERFAVSGDQTKIAWLESGAGGSNSIKLMDIETGGTNTITASQGEVLSVIDFFNQDLIYGIRGLSDNWIVNGRVKGLPIYSLRIIDPDLNTVMQYEKKGLYFEDIKLEGDRIHLVQYRKGTKPYSYNFASRDTIVSNEKQEEQYTKYISSADNETKKRVYYVDLDDNIKTTKNLKISAPKNISYEKSGNIDLGIHKSEGKLRFYAYANGSLMGRSDNLEDALALCYDEMGWVTDDNAVVLYSRADKSAAYSIREPFSAAQPMVLALENQELTDDRITDDGYAILDAQGIELNRLLYYINKGYPVRANLENGEYCLIYAYDRTSISLYYPSEDEGLSMRTTMEMEEAAQYFAQFQNDYICFIKYPGH